MEAQADAPKIEPADRPLGPPVPVAPARKPDRIVLEGRFVTLEPLEAERHAAALWAAVEAGRSDHIWDYMPDGPFVEEAAFRAFVAQKSASADPLFWAIVDSASGRSLGYATLMRIEPVAAGHRGRQHPLIRRRCSARPARPRPCTCWPAYVFDELGYRRYEWKCNALNAPSRRAACDSASPSRASSAST